MLGFLFCINTLYDVENRVYAQEGNMDTKYIIGLSVAALVALVLILTQVYSPANLARNTVNDVVTRAKDSEVLIEKFKDVKDKGISDLVKKKFLE